MLDTKHTDALVGRTDVPRSTALPAPLTQPLALSSTSPVGATAVVAVTPGFVTGLPAPQSTQMAPAPQQQAPAPQTRRRRTAAAEQPQQLAQVPAMAPFQATQPAAPNGGAAFGMAPGQAPDPALMSTLDQLFPKQA